MASYKSVRYGEGRTTAFSPDVLSTGLQGCDWMRENVQLESHTAAVLASDIYKGNKEAGTRSTAILQ